MRRLTTLILLLLSVAIFAQEAYDGYTLYNSNFNIHAYLLDMNGDSVHSWTSSAGGSYSCYLLEDGSLLKPVQVQNSSMNGSASTGRFERLDWDSNLVWQFDYYGNDYLPHHDIEPLPNGNLLIICWEIKTGTETYAAGRTSPITLWPDYIVEIQPEGTNGGEIVWEWHFWDHLIQDHDPSKLNYGVVEDHPELLDINLGGTSGGPGGGGGDWLHVNGIDYNEELDQIAISSHNLDEIYIIDHSTTTEEAAGHTGGNSGMGGDILYRWGNADNYGADDSYNFSVVHCAHWIASDCPGAGNLMAFNNGTDTHQSSAIEIELPYENTYNYSWTEGLSYAPELPVWEYSDGSGFYSNHLGSVQRLPNGNTLLCESTSGDMLEVDVSGNTVWTKNTSSEIARCIRYGIDYPGVSELTGEGIINGYVYDEITVLPVSNVEINIGDYEVFTDNNGFFELSLLPGNYELSCSHVNYEDYIYADDLEIITGETVSIDINLTPLGDPEGLLEGNIYDNNNSQLLEAVQIVIGEYETFTNNDGYFEIELPIGSYQLSCYHNGYEDYVHPDVLEIEEEETLSINIYLVPVSGSYDSDLASSILNLSNYPNPFNPETTIRFSVVNSNASTDLSIFNLRGQKLVTLINDNLPEGDSSIVWDGKDEMKKTVPSGIYLYKLTNGQNVSTKKMILMK